jgi:hypothetical protein
MGGAAISTVGRQLQRAVRRFRRWGSDYDGRCGDFDGAAISTVGGDYDGGAAITTVDLSHNPMV